MNAKQLLLVLVLATQSFFQTAEAGIIRVHLPVRKVMVPEFPGRKAARLYLPLHFNRKRSWPLVVLLHGYSSSARLQELYMMLGNHVTSKEFILLVPEGTTDSKGNQFWNATDFCCDFDQRRVNDSGYLQSLIDSVSNKYSVDLDRVSLFGHSNGGFMANRLACDAGGRFAAIATLAGTTFKDPVHCKDRAPIAVLHAHGTDDQTISYAGDSRFPGAEEYTSYWAGRNGCSSSSVKRHGLDLSPLAPGAETDVVTWEGCAPGADVVLWKMDGVGHIPFLKLNTTGRALDFLLSYRRKH